MRSSALTRAGRLLAALGAFTLLAVLSAGPAAAHSVLLQTSPAREGTLDTAPATVALTFNEMPQGEFSTIHVTGPDGQRRDNGHVQVVNDVVNEPLAGTRPAGRYVVDWRVVSADGHPVSGEFTFTVKSAAQQLVSRSASSDAVRVNRSNHTGVVVGVAAGVLVVAVAVAISLYRRPRRPDAAVHE